MSQLIIGADDVIGPWVCKQLQSTWTPNRGKTIGLIDAKGIVAGVVYENFNGASVSMHIATRGGNWLTRRFMWICFDYPFNQLGCKKLLGLVSEKNTAARLFDERLGFVQEARLKDCSPTGDLLIYTMTREQCKWLQLPERFHLQRRKEVA